MTDPPVDDIAAAIREPNLLRLYNYWLDRKGSRRFPTRREIDPLDVRYALGHIMLVDVLPAPVRFRMRLHGAVLVERAGFDLTGKTFDAIPDPAYREYVIRRCEGLVLSGRPLVVHHDRLIDGWPMPYEALWLPFSEHGANVTMLLCSVFYETRPPAGARFMPQGVVARPHHR
jgi:hypothetical protein